MTAMGVLHDAPFAESQKRQIRMKSAINLRPMRAAFGLKRISLKGYSQLKSQRSLSKGKRAAVPEHRLGELKPRKPERPHVSESIRLAQQGTAVAFEILYQHHCHRVQAL